MIRRPSSSGRPHLPFSASTPACHRSSSRPAVHAPSNGADDVPSS
nr:MAG TPA: hypothetical protein [Caudoviricetes sp.]